MLENKNKDVVQKEIKNLFAAFNKPQSYVETAVGFLMDELQPHELEEFVEYVQKTRTRAFDFGGEKLECPRPVDLISSIRMAARATQGKFLGECDCYNGFVTLFAYGYSSARLERHIPGRADMRTAGYVTDNTVTECSRCNGGKYMAIDPWYDRFIFSASGRWSPYVETSGLIEWRDHLFDALAEWDRQERQSARPMTFVDWPMTKSDLVASLVKRGLWPGGLTFFGDDDEPEEPEPEDKTDIDPYHKPKSDSEVWSDIGF